MFLSRRVLKYKKMYSVTESEISGIIWVLKKIYYMAKSTYIVCYVNHSALLLILKQSSISITFTI